MEMYGPARERGLNRGYKSLDRYMSVDCTKENHETQRNLIKASPSSLHVDVVLLKQSRR